MVAGPSLGIAGQDHVSYNGSERIGLLSTWTLKVQEQRFDLTPLDRPDLPAESALQNTGIQGDLTLR